ncbi:hypothetical protein BC938DRAFT_471463, partial [Jimgerdemannia flammicorona]
MFASAQLSVWHATLDAYPRALAALCDSKKGANALRLAELDQWYQETLPGLIIARKPDIDPQGHGAYLTREEVVKITEWKLKRGKFRPRLQSLVESNTDATVQKITSEAFAKFPNVQASLKILSGLKGVGPATASGRRVNLTLGSLVAILAAFSPSIPFMSDEAMEAVPGMGKIAYVEKYYLKYNDNINEKCEELNSNERAGELRTNDAVYMILNGRLICSYRKIKLFTGFVWTPRLLERTLWTYTVCHRFGIEIAEG